MLRLLTLPLHSALPLAALALLADSEGTVGGGPTSTDQVMCLSCHRAHASGWE